MDFKRLPSGPLTLCNVSVPGCLLSDDAVATDDGLTVTNIGIADGKIVEAQLSPDRERIEMSGAMVLPAFVDMHTHLDKGHIVPRAKNPDGSFPGALGSVRNDHSNWTHRDIYTRADFSLRCAYAHGTRAIRTHLDSPPPQDETSWPVFDQLREKWAGKIELQAASLAGCDTIDLSGRFQQTARRVKQYGGVLGLVVYPMEGLQPVLKQFFEVAENLGLEVDLHVDETTDPRVECIRSVCHAIKETSFPYKVTVGHLCSLSVQTGERAMDTLDLMADAALNVVSLPMCNLYLQDRHSLKTPGLRGVTLVHEMKQRGIPVSFASDNTRDPFYAYGDMDMLEVMREATRIAHLDHSDPDWVKAFSEVPAQVCNFKPATLAMNSPADLVIFNARNYTELHARPQSDRIVLRGGDAIDRRLPQFAELDPLFQRN